MIWKSGKNYPKSVVITDFGISTSIRISEYKRAVGTAGWAPPEQWLGQFMKWSVLISFSIGDLEILKSRIQLGLSFFEIRKMYNVPRNSRYRKSDIIIEFCDIESVGNKCLILQILSCSPFFSVDKIKAGVSFEKSTTK